MSEVCGDNRFELIGEFKGKLVECTNIETSPEEMAVLDNVLFRFWQMGWLDLLKAQEQKCRECGEATSKAIQELQAKLKAQEIGKVNITFTQSDGWKEGNCPFCGMKVESFYNWSFCGTCGKGLKWDA